MKLRQHVPVAYCINDKNIVDIASFVPAYLVKIGKNLWEVMDEHDEKMEKQLDWDGDDGLDNLWGLYVKHPDETFCEYFKSINVDVGKTGKAAFQVSPRRAELRRKASDNLEKAANSIIKRTRKQAGVDRVCEIGEVVHVRLKDEDKAKVDSGNLTGVIVDIDKSRSQARVAVKSGLLKGWYVYHRLGRVPGLGNNLSLNGLDDAMNDWKSMKVISERAASRNESLVGGQGKGTVTCQCKGTCNNNSCSCKKAGRICTSACHRNNFKCVNHDRGDD
jgi:hypothetical protein